MFAIIKTGGKQYKVEKGQVLAVEKLPKKEGAEVVFNKVLLISDKDNVTIGQPNITGAKVTGKLEQQTKAKKVIVRKYKNKTRYRRKQGHRQKLSKVKITAITKK
ncbi:50S ribosomal protein L21 [Patescibacteria group bacterium]